MDDRNPKDLINTDDLVTTDTNNLVATSPNNLVTSPTNTDDLTTNLNTHIHALPAELFDTIHDLVFIHPPNTKVSITAAYKPPPQLQISHTTREAFSAAYYSTTKFVYQSIDLTSSLGRKFRAALPDEHRRLIRYTYVVDADGSCCRGVVLSATCGFF
ncbi:hypothetical protein M409DRAFT_26916 [Zasmidium cellare ATCC 36951]|uniref:F-box domain-containing protein n=1 Tax=Zasmidium cellare ATCC 36951 TaxID=1080233 RepID=A0A6A6CAL2_ZASCE|nr:uncharacterized protein M409DRAFT_26916 [Zasmidium cellare ATCC 36951]KAF2162679.1 hypothetical protein M409DRAFT_26916 [Zasmidium cellare ATCC 36951]